ncbi:MAG TPA: anti-sigma factor [Roseiflexaceae bacterium]
MSAERSPECDDLQPWLAAYALGEAADDLAPRVHLAACRQCQRDLREYRRVAGLLPYGAPAAAPAPELRDQVIAAVSRAAGAEAPAAAPRAAQPRRGLVFGRVAWAALVFAALAVALLGWNISLQRQIADQASEIAFHRKSWQTMTALLNDSSLRWYSVAGDVARGHFWFTPAGDVACLVAQQLPPLASGQVYQVWLLRTGEQASGGTFEAHSGNGWALIHTDEPIFNYNAIVVTVEPFGGSAAPAGPRVLSGSLATASVPRTADRQDLLRLLGHA